LVAFPGMKNSRFFSTRYAGKGHLWQAVSLQVQFGSPNKM